MSITVYGASDDLIEVEGQVREEFTAVRDGEPNYLGFSCGVVLSVVYDQDGFWRIRALAGAEHVSITPGTDEDTDYSDRALIDADVSWVVHGASWARGGEGEA